MSNARLFESPTITRLQNVLESVQSGELLLPDFQRDFVWSDEQRLLLFDSVVQGMPIGSLLVWRTPEKLGTKRALGAVRLPDAGAPASGVYSYVLDGLQRLSTLYAALIGSEVQDEDVEGTAEKPRSVRWPVYFDLSCDPDEGDHTRFKLRGRGEVPPTWLPLSVLLRDERLWEAQQALFQAGLRVEGNRAKTLARRFADYELALVPMIAKNLDLATRTFERINTGGTTMGQPAMLRALVYARFDLTESFKEITDALSWPELDHTLLVNTLKAMRGESVYRADLRALADAIRTDPGELKRLAAGLTRAVDFLSQVCGVRGERALPYAYQLTALAVASAEGADLMAPAVLGALKRWFWATTYSEYFTGLNDGQLQRVFDDVKRIARGRPSRILEGLDPSARPGRRSADAPPDLVLPAEPLQTFNSNSVRALAQMHRLAERRIVDPDLREVDGRALLTRGAEVFVKLYPNQPADDPANRLLAAPEQARRLRKALDEPGLFSAQLRDGHLLPPLGDPAWTSPSEVLKWRRERLQDLERDFAEALRPSGEAGMDSDELLERAFADHALRAEEAARALGGSPSATDLAEWFFALYDDPANGVPYDGREGGYLYIYGGEADPEEELMDMFPDADSDALQEALQQIYSQGGAWVKAGIY